jgi:TonB family protein
MRPTLPCLTGLLVSVLALIAPRDVVALRVSAAQPPAASAQPEVGPWPPAGVYRPGHDGVTLPRMRSQVQPTYTAAAMREKLQGKVLLECVVEPDGSVGAVRVGRSLDQVFGLDEEAIKAAKQWRFAAGMKDNAAVPVLITIELTFALRAEPRPLTWPESFMSAGGTAIDTAEWIEDVSDVSGLQIRVAYPSSWTMRKDGPASRLILLQSAGGRGSRTLNIESPKPARFQLSQGATAETLQRLADTAKQGPTTTAGSAQVLGVGQMRAADRFWIWYDVWLPTLDVSNMPPGLGLLTQATFDGARMWTFITTAGSQEIAVGCIALYPRNASSTDMQHELQQAGAEFSAMLKRMSIHSR